MLFSKRLELVKEFHEWAQNANKDIRGGKIDENSFISFIAFLEIKGLINEEAVRDFANKVKDDIYEKYINGEINLIQYNLVCNLINKRIKENNNV